MYKNLSQKGFTLIELLVVIALLLSVIMPELNKAKDEGVLKKVLFSLWVMIISRGLFSTVRAVPQEWVCLLAVKHRQRLHESIRRQSQIMAVIESLMK